MRNETVFALGLVLLDLSCGNPILSSFPAANDRDAQGGGSSSDKEFLIRQLYSKVYCRETPNFVKAVTKCITGDFGLGTTPNFDNKEFRELFYRDVIAPLQADFIDSWSSACDSVRASFG